MRSNERSVKTEPDLLDAHLATYDVALTEHLVVEADAATVFEAAKNFDFMTTRSPVVTALMSARVLPSRLLGRAVASPEVLMLARDAGALPGWLVLGEVPGREVAFGAVGTFWRRDITWHDVGPGQFLAFEEPGWGKIAFPGLYAVQRPHVGTLGLLGAVGYAYAYAFFTGTVLLALVNQSPDWDALVGDLEPWVLVHGLLMLVAGSAFGVAVVRAGVLPRWTGRVLVVGVVLVAFAAFLPALVQVLCAGVRDLAFAGMGLSLLTRTPHIHTTFKRHGIHVHH